MKIYAAACHLFFFGTLCFAQKTETAVLLRQSTAAVQAQHFAPKPLDDSLSTAVFHDFLSVLDPNGLFFTQSDWQWLRAHEFQLDEALLQGRTDFLEITAQIFENAVQNAQKLAFDFLKNGAGIHFENLETPAQLETRPPENPAALAERWQKKVNRQLAEAWRLEQKLSANLPDEQRRQNILQRVEKILTAEFQAAGDGGGADALAPKLVNAYLKTHDAQTEYLTEKEKAAWDAEFTRSFVGIGVQLSMEQGRPMVTGLLAGGVAEQSKAIAPGDFLLKISDVQGQMLDVATGQPLATVTQLLQGEAGSSVRLLVQRGADSSILELRLTRAKIELEKTSAFVLQHGKTPDERIGYLRLPRFYEGDAPCSGHFLQALEQLNADSLLGLVVDLRDNQGGSAREAVKILGYFLQGGVLMQAKYRSGNQRKLEDDDPKAQFAGKLVVLVNSGSASASELFAGTLQDYGRAVVVGSPTYGKGSIQRFFDLNTDSLRHLGEVKMTIGNFYTAAGRSVQWHGVAPDVVLPDALHFSKTGERAFKNAFKTPDLPPTPARQDVRQCSNLSQIVEQSAVRIRQNPFFQQMSQAQNAAASDPKKTPLQRLSAAIADWSASPRTPAGTPAQQARLEKLASEIERDPFVFECFWVLKNWV